MAVPQFGPYLDSDILLETPSRSEILALTNVQLMQNGEPIGLDQSDRFLVNPRGQPEVYFTGDLVLKPNDLRWLSDRGLRYLQEEQSITMSISIAQFAMANVTAKVTIICKRQSPAMYMTSNQSDDLIMNSVHGRRSYRIQSLSAETHANSTAFLARFRWVRIIQRITEMRNFSPPLSIEVLVKTYREMHTADLASAQHRKSQKFSAPQVSHAQVRIELSWHAAWLLAFYVQGQTRKVVLDVDSWLLFIQHVEVRHERAPSNSLRKMATTLCEFGDTPDNWFKKLESAQKRSQALLSASTPIRPETTRVQRGPSPTYDSDFSEPSTPSWSGHDSEDDESKSNIVLPSWFSLMRTPPQFHPTTFIWECPLPHCDYYLDLLRWPRMPREDETERYRCMEGRLSISAPISTSPTWKFATKRDE
ncbi:hypothetical protein MIND_01085300 [Mycena indigotica]|uniref:Uncharacterized protein n=1 Tax=Mycena indigotica TaxID=2126181 RepID=A0A8H6SB08_9AGAR|nr:uncharacterized protein MIND_01085300 [Mycena indigotica]KAF7295455.1 hypothetical protein MIND_01085300 [Mycena indigotica]